LSRLPSLGPRGEGWVLIQFLLLPAIALAGLLDPAAITPPPVLALTVGLALMGAGALLLGKGLLDLGRSLTPLPHPRDDAQLVVSGVYALVRHPIYGGIIVTSFGWGLVAASPVTLGLSLVLLAFFSLKARREEAWLQGRYEGYEAYAARTKRFVPYLL
jgi:protein-S-isoprenylcysteine O-methyltransferase Ste14